MKPYRIMLADDHVLFRQGVKTILQSAVDLAVVGEAGDGIQLLELLKKVIADLVILDISMPNLRGVEACREIKSVSPTAKILILTMHREKEYVYHTFSAGAHGYLLKEDADTELFAAIENMKKGKPYISPLLSDELTHEFIQAFRKGSPPAPSIPLTLREREILKLIAEGASNKEIAELLYISIRTVENHRANMMKKLGIRQTANLVKYAIREGYTSSGASVIDPSNPV